MSEQNIGTVVQITGPVLDIKFAADALPKLLNAITIDNHGQIITVEVAQHIGRGYRALHRNGIHRRLGARHEGSRYRQPDHGAGRRQEPWTYLQPARSSRWTTSRRSEDEERWPIHRPAPSYEEQQSTTEILETGIKVVDLIAPYRQGRQDRSVRRRRRRQDRSHHGADQQHRKAARRYLRIHRRRRAYP